MVRVIAPLTELVCKKSQHSTEGSNNVFDDRDYYTKCSAPICHRSIGKSTGFGKLSIGRVGR